MISYYNFLDRLSFVGIDALGFQQAILFFLLGFAILASGGAIVQDELYKNPSMLMTILTGFSQLLFGFFYFFTLYLQKYNWVMRFSWVAAAIWFLFAGFYFANSVHRIGAVTCLVLGGTNTFCCYSCRGKR